MRPCKDNKHFKIKNQKTLFINMSRIFNKMEMRKETVTLLEPCMARS